jgi:hypothetical protein
MSFCWERNSWNVFTDPLPSDGHGADHIENTFCNTFPVVGCLYFGRCLEMGLYVTVHTYIHTYILTEKIGSSDDAFNLWSWGASLKSCPGHRLSWPMFAWFTSVPQASVRIVPQIRPRLLLFVSFQINCSAIIIPSDAIYSEILRESLNRT